MTSVRRALALSLVERYLLMVLALAASIIIARLLTPEQIGIYSVSLAVIGVAQVLRDFGIGNFLIQEQNLSDDHIRTAFGLSLLLGSALFVIVFLAAPLAGRFYGEASMVDTVRIVAINFLVLPFCTISLALLRRGMQFQRLLYVQVSAGVVGFVVAISLAYTGHGPNSLAIGAVVTSSVTGLGAWLARADRKLLLPSLSHWRIMGMFGAQNSAAGIVTTIAMDINDLAVGRILGFAPVAMISRAQGLMSLFHRDVMGAIRNVAFPAFAVAHREGCDLEARHVAAVVSITAVAWPFYLFLALFAPEVMRLLYGPQWDAAAPLVPWFCIGGAAAALYGLIIPLLTARGRNDLGVTIDLVLQPIRAVVTVLAVWWFASMAAFAVVFACLSILSVFFHYWVKSRVQQTNVSAMMIGLGKSLLSTIAASVAPLIVTFYGPRDGSLVSINIVVIAAVLSVIMWSISMITVRHPLTFEPTVSRLLASIPWPWRNTLSS